MYAFVIYFEIVNWPWLQNAMLCNYVFQTCTTVPTLCTGYTYVHSYIYVWSFVRYRSNSTASGSLLTLKMRECMQCARYENGIPISYRCSYITPTNVRIVCILSFLQMLATNTSNIAIRNWFMHARVTMYVRSYSYILPC